YLSNFGDRHCCVCRELRRDFQQYRAASGFRRALAVRLRHWLAGSLRHRPDRVSFRAPGDHGNRRHDRARLMLSTLALARGVEAGDMTPRKLVETCAEAIAAREKDIGAFVTLDLAGARRAAEDTRLASLPLRGLPVAFKDIFDTADLPT